VKLFKCDRCGRTEEAQEDCDYAEDWEKVTVSTAYHFDICKDCSRPLFEFLSPTKREN
jgi:hypothetical protein